MKKWILGILPVVVLMAASCWAISTADLLRLKRAGIGDATIQVIIREKVVETCAFSVQDLIDLKTKARLSDKTIQQLVTANSFLKDRAPVVYSKDIQSIQFTTADDIIKLKQAGLSDAVIQSIILVGSGSGSDSDRDKAWNMLNNMGIIVDTRKKP